jgi:hypothetical protein
MSARLMTSLIMTHVLNYTMGVINIQIINIEFKYNPNIL